MQYAGLRQVKENVWLVSGEDLSFMGKKIPPHNFIVRKENGRYDLMGVMKFEDYIAGVVASEMPTSWPMEALKSQAVVARSFALARIQERFDKSYHLDADQNDQVFSVQKNPRARAAVKATAGVILVKPGGKVLKAYFHADCGGETVSASQVWGAREFDSGTATDSWCADRHSNEWSFEVKKQEFLEQTGLKNIEQKDLEVGQNSQSLRFGNSFFSVQKLREIFGFYNIRSRIQQIKVGDEVLKITGKGFGHGAGLCQWGSLAQARLGKGYLGILSHYFSRASLVSY